MNSIPQNASSNQKPKQRRVIFLLLVGLLPYIVAASLYVPQYVKASREWKAQDEARKQAWEAQRQELIENSPDVYVTPHGEKYHRRYHYRGKTDPLTLYEAIELGYEACETCSPPEMDILKPLEPMKPLPWYFSNAFLIGGIFSLVYWAALTRLLRRYELSITVSRGYKYIGFVVLSGAALSLLVYFFGYSLNLVLSVFFVPPIIYLFLAGVGMCALVIEDNVAPKSTVILSWVLAAVISFGVFLLINLSTAMLCLLVFEVILLGVYSRLYWKGFAQRQSSLD